MVLLVGYLLSRPDDTNNSYVKTSSSRLIPKTSAVSKSVAVKGQIGSVSNVDAVLSHAKNRAKVEQREHQPRRTRKSFAPKNIKYKATQVIGRDDTDFAGNAIPIGTNFIGKLLTAIDSRDQGQFIKVLLPYGGAYKGRGSIPKNSMLFGTIHYPGRGEKIFIKFNRGIYPDGREFKIEAQALNSKNYSSGLIGNHHGTAGIRIATTLGLSMISGMTSVLTAKEVLGTSDVVTPKATMKNAMLHGVSKVTEMESQRQAAELAQDNIEYVTVEAGSDMIISLTKTFKGGLN